MLKELTIYIQDMIIIAEEIRQSTHRATMVRCYLGYPSSDPIEIERRQIDILTIKCNHNEIG